MHVAPYTKHRESVCVCVQERGESFYNPVLPDVVQKLQEAGILEDSNGAKVVWTEPEEDGNPPLMVQKSDGGFGYARYATHFGSVLQFHLQKKDKKDNFFGSFSGHIIRLGVEATSLKHQRYIRFYRYIIDMQYRYGGRAAASHRGEGGLGNLCH